MKTGVLIAAGGLVLLLVIGFLLWRTMTGPMYRVGQVAKQKRLTAPLDPPNWDGAAGTWPVEDDVDLYFFQEGQGPAILFVAGGPGVAMEAPVAGLTTISADYAIYYYHQRGSGGSSHPIDQFASDNTFQNMRALEQKLGLGAQLADIERIRRHLGQEKIILVGHSFGAFMSTLYAAEFPERVEAMVLVAPADVLVFPQSNGGAFELIRSRLNSERQVDFDRFLEAYLDFNGMFGKSEAEMAALNHQFTSFYGEALGEAAGLPAEVPSAQGAGWMVQATYLSMGQRHDYRPALDRVAAPVLVIHGSQDLMPAAVSRSYADLLPNANFYEMTGAGHFPYIEQPKEFAQIVTQFLDELR